jgi:NADH-quinone oxidoreductase subunit N
MLATNLLPRNIVNVYNIEFLVKFVETAYEKNLFFNSRGMPINKYIIDSGFQEHQELLNSLAANNLVNSVYYSEPFLSIYLIIVFILVNLCFKLTASPFHFWAPTVYGGAPLATLTFLSIFSKAVIVFFFAWLFIHVFEDFSYIWQPLCLLIACLSVIFSILGAFSEKVFKRFFVYSSTGHVGFLLIGIAVLNINGIKGTVDYLLIYIVSSFIIWFIIMHLTRKTVTLINLKGLALNNPFLGFIFSIVIFSLSGIPPMGGFFVKYEIFYSLLNSSFFYIAYLLLFLTIISFFYYLRLIKIVFFENQKTFNKNKMLSDIKLRLISYGFFIIPFYMIFIENPFAILLKAILINSL